MNEQEKWPVSVYLGRVRKRVLGRCCELQPFHTHDMDLETIHWVALAWRWKACMLALISSACSHSHTHINACASISARLASFTWLCTAPYAKPCSSPLHSMHTISILLDDITARSLQWLAGTKVYYLESARFFKTSPTSPMGDVFQSGLVKA